MSRVLIFDTTLRDGEQSPGSGMIAPEKLRMAHELADLGVDGIEAGVATGERAEAEAIRLVAREVRGPVVAALTGASEDGVRAAAEVLDGADRPRIQVLIATSDVLPGREPRDGREECVARAVRAVELARTYVDDVALSAVDATRTDTDFLCEVAEAVVEAGASTINLPDTVGYALPHEVAHLVGALCQRVPTLGEEGVVGVRCRDDLGLAAANTLAGIEAGARQVECTINGIGERAGNAALEEVVMALRVRSGDMGHRTGIRHERLYRASRLLAYLTGVTPQPNKAVVGSNAFAPGGGARDDFGQQSTGYEIMRPEMVGAPGASPVTRKDSGREGLEARYRALGYDLTPEEIDRVSRDFEKLADRKQEVLDEDLLSILHHEVMEDVAHVHRLDRLDVTCGGEVSVATLSVASEGGPPRSAKASGDGPIAAAFAAAEELMDFKVVLEDLRIRAATPGRDALGEVTIKARVDGHTFTGRGAATDVVTASVGAYLHVINKAEAARALEARHLASVADAWGV